MSTVQTDKDVQLSLQERKVLELAEKYQKMSGNFNNYTSEEQINNFVEYAVDIGFIQDTPEARDAITKDLVRSTFKAAIFLGGIGGLDMAVEFLDHSLQDNPSSLSYDRGTTYSNDIKNSDEYQSLIEDIKDQLDKETDGLWSEDSSITLNSTNDLLLALNKVDYLAAAEKVNGKWDIYIRFSDNYNFEYWKWRDVDGYNNALVTAINNYGALAEDIGAIVAYYIAIYTGDTY